MFNFQIASTTIQFIMKPRTYFYLPKKKISTGTNAHSMADRLYNEFSINDQIENFVSDSLYEKKFIPNTQYAIATMNALRSQLTFFSLNAERDNEIIKDFDLLTIPKDAFNNIKPHLRFEFDSDHFTISNPANRKTLSYHYNEKLIPILKCLETKTVNSELYEILKIIHLDLPEEGHFVCECIDFRVEQTYETIILLRINLSTMLHNVSGDQAKQKETEQNVLLFSKSQICTDPSPDVSRVMSVFDWREKMWNTTHTLENEKNFIPDTKPVIRVPKKFPAPPVTNKQIHISDSLQSVFAGIAQHPM